MGLIFSKNENWKLEPYLLAYRATELSEYKAKWFAESKSVIFFATEKKFKPQ